VLQRAECAARALGVQHAQAGASWARAAEEACACSLHFCSSAAQPRLTPPPRRAQRLPEQEELAPRRVQAGAFMRSRPPRKSLTRVPPTARGCVEARAGEGAGGEAAGGAEEADCRGARSARAPPRGAGGGACHVRALGLALLPPLVLTRATPACSKTERLEFMYKGGGSAMLEGPAMSALPPPAAPEPSVPLPAALAAPALTAAASAVAVYVDDTPKARNEAWARLHGDPMLMVRLGATKRAVAAPDAKPYLCADQAARAVVAEKHPRKSGENGLHRS